MLPGGRALLCLLRLLLHCIHLGLQRCRSCPAALCTVLAGRQVGRSCAQRRLQLLHLRLPLLLGGGVRSLRLRQGGTQAVPFAPCRLHPSLQLSAAGTQLLPHRLQLLHLAQQRRMLLLQPLIFCRQLVCPLLQCPGWIAARQAPRQLLPQ